MDHIRHVAFDADDTLWHNERIFSQTQGRFYGLLTRYHSEEWIQEKLYATEMRNLRYFGYGIKGFTLSMIETAIELTEGRIQGSEIQQIIQFGREMLAEPVQLLEHVEETLDRLANSHNLMLVTKGDLFDQEAKIARSGLENYFSCIEIVSEKDEPTYGRILSSRSIEPREFLMVGNSLRSDVFPVLAIGGSAVYIPYHLTWEYERVEENPDSDERFIQLEHIGYLPELLNGEAHPLR